MRCRHVARCSWLFVDAAVVLLLCWLSWHCRCCCCRPGGTEKYEVQARGEMQLAVIIEGLRREGMELAVSPPQVLLR
jgi:hypothetical protein